jgi:hypothetical protein
VRAAALVVWLAGAAALLAGATALLVGAAAADEPGTVTGGVKVLADGVERADAGGVLVYVTGFREPPPRAPSPAIVQHDKRFEPPLVAITAGQEVSFPNADPFFHNVFSPSPTQRFDLGQYKMGETKTRLFPQPGFIEVYCNIHPQMAATILVLPNRRFTITEPDGSYRIAGVPAGTWRVFAYDRQSSVPAQADVTVAAGGTAVVDLTVVETRASSRHKNKYGEEYREPDRYR